MLRMARFRAEDDEDVTHLYDENYFRQIFAFQWIRKQPKILDFLFEHSETIIGDDIKKPLIKFIKKELKNMIDENSLNIIPVQINKIHTFDKLKHIAIYSQNLLLLWLTLEKQDFIFKISNQINSVQVWKVFVDLWKNYGSYEYVSYLTQYIDVNIENETVTIQKASNSMTKFSEYSNYTHIANNNYETILSYYTNNQISLDEILKLNSSENEFLSSDIANLIIYNIEYLYTQNSDYFHKNTFWSLWENSSFYNKIKLSNFFLDKNIYYKKLGVAKYIYNSILEENLDLLDVNENLQIREELSFSEKVYAIKHFIKVEKDNLEVTNRILEEVVRKLFVAEYHLLVNLVELLEISLKINNSIVSKKIFETVYNESEEGRLLSFPNQIKLFKFSIKIVDPVMSAKILQRVFSEANEGRRLSLSDQIKLLKLSLEVGVDRMNHEIAERIWDESDRGIRLSLSDQIKLLELSLKIGGDRMSHDILERVFRESHKGQILSLSDQIKLLELSLEIGGDRMSQEILDRINKSQCSRLQRKHIERLRREMF